MEHVARPGEVLSGVLNPLPGDEDGIVFAMSDRWHVVWETSFVPQPLEVLEGFGRFLNCSLVARQRLFIFRLAAHD